VSKSDMESNWSEACVKMDKTERQFNGKHKCATVYTNSVSVVHRGPKKKIGKLKGIQVRKLQKARQARTGRNMVKSCSPYASSSWLMFICPLTSPQNLPPLCF
jgi:hypothetical protein